MSRPIDLEFTRTEPAYYSAMFEAGVPLDGNQELREAGDREAGDRIIRPGRPMPER